MSRWSQLMLLTSAITAAVVGVFDAPDAASGMTPTSAAHADARTE